MSDVPPPGIPAPPLIIWFDAVFALWRRRWPLWLEVGALYSVLSWLVGLACYHAFGVGPTGLAKVGYPVWRFQAALYSSLLINLPLYAIFAPACVLLALRLQRGEPAHLSDLAPVLRFFWRALGTQILTALILIIGVLACCVGILVAYPVTYLAMPVVVAEDAGPARAIRRSWKLTQPQFWRMLLFALLFSLMTIGFSSIITVAGYTNWLGQTITVVIAAFTGPLIVISQTVAYTFSTGESNTDRAPEKL